MSVYIQLSSLCYNIMEKKYCKKIFCQILVWDCYNKLMQVQGHMGVSWDTDNQNYKIIRNRCVADCTYTITFINLLTPPSLQQDI